MQRGDEEGDAHANLAAMPHQNRADANVTQPLIQILGCKACWSQCLHRKQSAIRDKTDRTQSCLEPTHQLH
jgi:hypothetical protein